MKAKTSRLDIYLISIMLVVFFYTGWKLFVEGFESITTVNQNPLASIKVLNNTVKNKSGNLFAWNDAYNNQDLFSGDQLYTHENSKVEVIFKDESLLTLYENTLIKIEETNSERIVTLKEGIIFIRGKEKGKLKIRVRNSNLVLTSDMAKIQVKEQDEKTDFLILEGSADIKVDNKNFKVAANEYLSIGDKNSEIKVKQLNYKILTPNNESSFPLSTSINFTWEKKNLNEVNFQLSKDQKFNSFMVNKKTNHNKISYMPGQAGLYYWRLTPLKQSSPSEVRSLYVFEPILVLSPLSGSTVRMKKPDSGLQFRWEDAKGLRYLIEVSKESSFKTIEFAKTSDKTFLTWPQAKTGDYFWRIKKLGNKNENFSPAKEIFIRRPEPPKAPSIKKIPRRFKLKTKQTKKDFSLFDFFISPAYAEALGETQLTWPKSVDAKEYIVEVYSDKLLKIPLMKQRVSKNQIIWKNPKMGKFYWRLAIVDFWDQVSPFSEIIEAEVIDTNMKKRSKPTKKKISKKKKEPLKQKQITKSQKTEYFQVINKIIDSHIEIYQSPTLVKFKSEQGRVSVNTSGLTLASTGIAYLKRISKESAVKSVIERTSGSAFETNTYSNLRLELAYLEYFYLGQNSPLFYSLGIVYDQQSYYLKKGISDLTDESNTYYAGSFTLGLRFARKSTSYQNITLNAFAGTSFGGGLEYNYSYIWSKKFSLLAGAAGDLKYFSTSENVDGSSFNSSLKFGARYHF